MTREKTLRHKQNLQTRAILKILQESVEIQNLESAKEAHREFIVSHSYFIMQIVATLNRARKNNKRGNAKNPRDNYTKG